MYRKPKKAISIPYAEILIDEGIKLGFEEIDGKYGISFFVPFNGLNSHQLHSYIKRHKQLIKENSSLLPKKTVARRKPIIGRHLIDIYAKSKLSPKQVLERVSNRLKNSDNPKDIDLYDKLDIKYITQLLNRRRKLASNI